ncbi:MAG: cytochrome c biogenesis protein CcsA [Bacteroidetes bacterium]|nr:cytochrome c biogenesis protein CcsA [Bacteroidota bacterium]MBS1757980.1 cytochrome c biogenesis protein CcsA [Bacteroidota bacterium]
MKFEGEHLFPGQLGHFFVILSFIAALIATISFFTASRQQDPLQKQSWLRFARMAFFIQVIGVIIVFSTIFYICSHHYYEYMYAYKHTSQELEYKYLLACIWEGQEGSFLLWTIWQSVIGIILIFKSKEWEAPVMSVISLAQFFLLMMILGIYFFDIRIGNSPFTLTRNEIAGPIFSQPNYLSFIKDGIGLNVLLRNYWMVIHPPVLFLGFASTVVPFAYAYAGLQTKRYGDWIKPLLPWALMSATVLGVGIMMGGKWAYESLNFGGYWAWDPVENASFVPWLILIAGLHTMVVYKATGHSLRASYLFAMLAFIFILYSTYLTRTGILGDTSVHAFTEAGKAINLMILLFLLFFAVSGLSLLFFHYKKIPAIHTEENTNSREFWMFIGSLVIFLTALFISAKTSVPVYNKIFNTHIAPPEDVEFSYNKIVVLVAIIVGVLTAITQYFKYKTTGKAYLLKNIVWPTAIAAALALLLAVLYPYTFWKHGVGFLGAIYLASFACIYAVVANAFYIFKILKGKFVNAGGSVAHAGFALMIVGMLISAGNKEVISSSMVNGINLPASKDPMTKQDDDPKENLTLIRELPTKMADYQVTYIKDSAGHEKGRNFYELHFERKNPTTQKITESFVLQPDVYIMKDNNMSSNPDTKAYLTKDIFTYVTFALNKNSNTDTSTFKVRELNEGDTTFYSNGMLILNKVEKNPSQSKFDYDKAAIALQADITVISKDSMHYKAKPLILVDSLGISQVDDTVFAQNLYVRFSGVTDTHKIKIGVKESDKLIDFVTVKAYVFPYINLVWLGLIIMAVGLVMSMIKRGNFSKTQSIAILVFVTIALFYMFLLANQ